MHTLQVLYTLSRTVLIHYYFKDMAILDIKLFKYKY